VIQGIQGKFLSFFSFIVLFLSHTFAAARQVSERHTSLTTHRPSPIAHRPSPIVHHHPDGLPCESQKVCNLVAEKMFRAWQNSNIKDIFALNHCFLASLWGY